LKNNNQPGATVPASKAMAALSWHSSSGNVAALATYLAMLPISQKEKFKSNNATINWRGQQSETFVALTMAQQSEHCLQLYCWVIVSGGGV